MNAYNRLTSKEHNNTTYQVLLQVINQLPQLQKSQRKQENYWLGDPLRMIESALTECETGVLITNQDQNYKIILSNAALSRMLGLSANLILETFPWDLPFKQEQKVKLGKALPGHRRECSSGNSLGAGAKNLLKLQSHFW
jgi:signal transduction histidine kinase